jgi:hypothetical protein
MKITKQRIKEIIKEEMELAGSESDLKKRMKELSNAIAGDQVKIDPAEAEQIDKLITRIFSAGAAENPSTADLKKANDYITQYLKTDTITEDVLEEASWHSARSGIERDYKKWKDANTLENFIKKYSSEAPPYKGFKDLSEQEQTKYLNYVKNKLKTAQEQIKINKAEAQASTPQEQEKVEKAQDQLDQVEDKIEQEAEAEMAAAPAPEEKPQAEPEEIPEKLKQFQDSKFYKTIQDEETKQGLSFIFKYFIDNKIISEGLKDVVIGLGIKPADLRKSLMVLKNEQKNIFKKVVAFLKDENNTNAFVDVMRNFIPQSSTAEEPAKEGDVEVVDDGRKYTYTDENIQQLKTAYQKFEDGFMSAKNRVEQEELWINLRNALNVIGQFREIGRKERAYVGEQLINIFENENQQNFKRIVVDIERLRRDLNDTDETLVNYLKAANAGQYESQAYLAKFLAELKDVQNSVKRTVEDVQKVGGFKLNEQEEETAEPKEETFEQKVAKVRGVYEKIKREFSETLTQLDKTNAPELEEFSGRIKDAYDQLESIRYLFSRVGAFAKTSNKDVNELQEDYKIAKGKLTKAMSRTLSDLRAGQVDPNQLKVFLTDLLGVADWISTNFGVGPDEQYRVQGVTVQSDGKDKEEVTQDTDDSGGEPLTPEAAEEAPPDAGMPDPDEVEPAKTPMDELKDFYNNNTQFYNVIIQLYKALGNNDEASIEKIKKLLPQLKKLNENVSNDPKSILNILTKIKIELINLFQEIDLIELTGNIDKKDKIYESIKIFAGLMLATKKMIEAEESKNTSLVDKLKSKINSKIKQLINSIMSFTKDGEEKQAAEEIGASEKTLDKLKKSAANLKIAREKETEKSRQRKIYKSMEKGSDPEDYGKDPTRYMEESNNLLERLIKQELKVLNGKKMVRN